MSDTAFSKIHDPAMREALAGSPETVMRLQENGIYLAFNATNGIKALFAQTGLTPAAHEITELQEVEMILYSPEAISVAQLRELVAHPAFIALETERRVDAQTAHEGGKRHSIGPNTSRIENEARAAVTRAQGRGMG